MGVSSRQPGVYFYTAAPASVSELPRMDVAGFVGFASNGPLHVPVLVEDMAHFRDIFGDDLALAWDPQLKRMQTSLLGSCVESFFRNGGLRCWVVRVAGDDASIYPGNVAQLARFQLAGLYRADDLQAAVIQARSPGSWAEHLSVSTRLNIQSLAAGDTAQTSSPDHGLLNKYPDHYRVRLRSVPADLQAGDLLEIRCGQQGLRAYLFVQSLQPDDAGIAVQASDVYWFETPPASPDDTDPGLPIPLDESLALSLYDDFITSSPAQLPAIRWLRFDLLVWRGEALASQLNGLAFHPSHPRFWGHLPDDQLLYGDLIHRNPVSLSPSRLSLMEEVGYPRFALAGDATDADNQQACLPLTMGISSLAASALPADFGDDQSPAPSLYARDGLAVFNADLFLDPDLAGLGTASLLAEANHQRYSVGRSLRGIHCLLGIDEISMIAVPDMLHRHWDTLPPGFEPPLTAPVLNPIEAADNHGMRRLNWTEVNNARRYILQKSLSGDFTDAVEYRVERPSPLQLESDHQWPQPPDPEIRLAFPEDCPRHYFFRVRAEAYGQFSPWSNSRTIRLPASSFSDCDKPDPSLLGLRLIHDTSVPVDTAVALSWQAEDSGSPVFSLADRFQLQRASDMDFIAAETVYPLADEPGNLTSVELPVLTDAVAYFRVRAWSGEAAGPWSNTWAVNPGRLAVQTLKSVEAYNNEDLKAVQWALIRLCAARADALAVLCLPAHYQDAQVASAVDDLAPRSRVEPGAMASGSGLLSVPALNTGEQSALSYAALYSPWLRQSAKSESRLPTGQANVLLVPPDGAVCGKLAATANLRGAWIASENKLLQDVLGLGYRSTDDMQASLADKQVNIITAAPRGFVVSRASTLSRSSELKPLNVRRLLLLLRRLAMREGGIYLFEPNSVDFRNRVQHYWESLLNDLYRRGAFRGNSAEAAYRVVTDESVNDARSLELGRFVVELQVSPSQPMSFIHVRLIQSGSDQLLFQEF